MALAQCDARCNECQCEEIQLHPLVNGGSNYELLLEEAVRIQNSLMKYKNIQSKLDGKIQAMNSHLSTQQKVLNELFHNSNKELDRSQVSNNKFFTIEDLKILESIRQERVVREERTQNQLPQSNDIMENNVRNNNFPYKNLNNNNDFPYNYNNIHNSNIKDNNNNNSILNKNSTNKKNYYYQKDSNKNIGFYSNKNMEQLENELKIENKTKNKNFNSLNKPINNSSSFENAEK